jgi:uncharacterized protein (DUF1778 family)
MSRTTTTEPPKSATAAPGARAARGARLEARVSLVQKNLFQRAADLSGRTLSEFVVASAQDAAERLIQDQNVIRLTPAEQTAFVKGLLEDTEPAPRLRQAAATYKKRIGLT